MKEQLIREVQRQMLPYLNNAQLKPVSYTHLDVYKRQSKDCKVPQSALGIARKT